jgi:hypothetical protein
LVYRYAKSNSARHIFLFSEGMGFLDGKARKWLEAAL